MEEHFLSHLHKVLTTSPSKGLIDIIDAKTFHSILETLGNILHASSFIIPSILTAIVTIFIWQWNKRREHHRFLICCLCLYEEVKSHKEWIALFMQEAPPSRKIFLDRAITQEFDHIKYDDVFRLMSKDNYQIIFNYYQSISTLHFLLQKTPEENIRRIFPDTTLNSYIQAGKEVVAILEENIKKNTRW